MGNGEMGGDPGRLRKEIIRRLLTEAGAAAVGFANVGAVAPETTETWTKWIAAGRNASMAFMERHEDLRINPGGLLEGAKSMICLAFPYRIKAEGPEGIARYALLPDYHDWVKTAIRNAGIGGILGAELTGWRICVDSAPLFERWWGAEAGIGIRGDNGSLIIPGIGSEVILAEILTTSSFEADTPTHRGCEHCGACRRICPAGALQEDGTIDCNLCLSYLTIEHRGPWEDRSHRAAMATPEGRRTFFGCDRCIKICPHNRRHSDGKRSRYQTQVIPNQNVTNLTAEKLLTMEEEEYRTQLKGSALRRAKLPDLRRNALNCIVERNTKAY